MKPSVTSLQMLTWLCLLPAEENASKWKKRAYIALVFALILADLTVFCSSSMYVVKFVSIDVLESSFGIYQVTAAIPMANAIVVAYLFRQKIQSVFEKLLEFYEKCTY